MEIKFGHIGESLGTRVLGQKLRHLRHQIEEAIAKNDFVIFNFLGVQLISHSFADECFGKLLIKMDLAEMKSTTTFENTNPKVKKMIAFVLKERIKETELC